MTFRKSILFALLSLATAGVLTCGSGDNRGDSEMNEKTETTVHTNRLIDASSPYLRQHAHNPVDWYPWGNEALAKAREENKPIFLSIGYAACHWCHVMEKESFEDSATAAILNKHFIAIKVDREERPDLDQIYMAATQALTGGGGWPMSVFLTPDLKPFYAGTYFPPVDAYGRPGFKTVLNQIASVYENDRARVDKIAEDLTGRLQQYFGSKAVSVELPTSIVETAARGLLSGFDPVNGGFGSAPKFPHPAEISFLFKYALRQGDEKARHAALYSLRQMARGGIYDHIGGGFHRYSVDAEWLVPHFEKMLYDNALLAVAYSEAYQITGEEIYREVVTGTLDFVLREMTDSEGGFYSSLDADSEGEEGRFYVWKKDEVNDVLGNNAGNFSEYFNITAGGNFEGGTNIPNINSDSDLYLKNSALPENEFFGQLEISRSKLFEVRANRERPFTDDKILTSWNGLMISGFAYGYQITGDEKYRRAAVNAADFILDKLYDSNNDRLEHSYREGKIGAGPFLEDYAYFILGLIDLYEVEYDYKRIEAASALAENAVKLFSDQEGSLYLTSDDRRDLYMRPRDISDGAIPSPGSILIQTQVKLAEITGQKDKFDQAERLLKALSGNIDGRPDGMISAVSAFDMMLADKVEIVVVGKKNRESFAREIYSRYLPHRVILFSADGTEKTPLLEGRLPDETAVAYVCVNYTCKLPTKDADQLKTQLDEL